jgi:hypothetical protein
MPPIVKRIALIAAGIVIVFVLFRYCEFKKDNGPQIEETALIQEQIKNVGKLVVTEGHFSEVLTYKDQQKYLMDMISFEKKAIVIVNADVTVSYDLSQVHYDINESAKTITITNIPKEEIKINPELKFYDIEQNGFNEFNGDDYNKINQRVKESLRKKIEKSTLKTNAQNRLISELSKILILTNTMGWKLQYNGQQIDNQNLQRVLP